MSLPPAMLSAHSEDKPPPPYPGAVTSALLFIYLFVSPFTSLLFEESLSVSCLVPGLLRHAGVADLFHLFVALSTVMEPVIIYS